MLRPMLPDYMARLESKQKKLEVQQQAKSPEEVAAEKEKRARAEAEAEADDVAGGLEVRVCAHARKGRVPKTLTALFKL